MAVSWTCPDCGLVYDSLAPQDAIQALRSFPRRYREVIGPFIDDEDVLRRRPDPSPWSALEYTAHVADVFETLTSDILKMVQADDPRLPDAWNPDERAEVGQYNEMEPRDALDWLERSATQSADTLSRFSSDDWSRTGQFDFGQRDVLDMVRNMVHEGVHHLRDVERVLRAVIGKPLPTDDEDE